jgi:adhesin/invasin
VTVSPRDTVVAGTPAIAYSATAVDSAGAPVTNLLVSWTSSDVTVATATSTGNAAASVRALGKRGSSTISARTPLGITGSSVLTVVPPAARLVVISGGGQTGPAGSSLPLPFVVEAQAADNLPVPGTSITFRSVTAGGSVSQILPRIADAAGRASTLMTLGTASGAYQFEAAAPGLTPVTVSQTALAGAATNIAIFSGNLQTEIVGRALPLPLVVQVTDQFGSPVAGATVTWARSSGSGSVSAATTTTIANGTASITYTLGAAPGGEVITATLQGGGSVQFGATANVVGAGSIVVVSGGGQTGAPNSLLAQPLVVRVNDAGGNPLTGQLVTFTSAGATFNPASFTTGANGLATTAVTLGGTVGSVTLTATSGALSVSTGATISVGPAASIAKVAGDLQSATVGTAVAIAPSVVVKDAGGNPVPNAPVVFAVASGGGVATGLTTTTNAQGIATVGSWTLGGSVGANTLTATTGALSTTFSASAVAGTGSVLAIGPSPSPTTPSGVPFVRQPAVQLWDANHNNVQTAGVVITASVTSGTATLTNATATTGPTGLATFTALTATGPLGNFVITFATPGYTPVLVGPFAIVAGSPSTIALSAGNNQTAATSTAVAIPPAVIVTDAGGNPVAGVSVTFGVITPGAQISNGTTTGTTLSVVTNNSGVAALASWTLGATAQSYTLNATATGLSGSPVVFTATATAGPASQLAFVVQPPSTATIGAALVPQPSIQLKDASGNNVATAGVVVNALISAGGTLVNSSATTNGSGVATFSGLGFTGATGNFTLQFGATGFANLAFGTVVVSAGAPSAIALSAGNNQSATVGTPVPVAPAVLVTDASGNPVSGTVVTFAAVTAGSSVSNGVTTGATVTVATNASGVATLTAWTLGNTPQSYSMTAAVSGLTGSPVTFTATAVAGSGSQLALTQQPSSNTTSGAALTVQPVVQVRDAFGNNVASAGVQVTASIISGTGSLTNATALTNGAGVATFTGLAITGPAGQVTLQFSAAGYTSVSSAPITVAAGSPAALVFAPAWNPGPTPALSAFSPAPSVQLVDASGSPVAQAGVGVTVTIASGPSSPTPFLVSNTTSTNASGVASFPGLAVGGASGTYTLTFTATGLTPVTSGNVVITSGPGTTLAIQAGNGQTAAVATAVATAPAVLLTDQFGNPVANQTVTFTVLTAGSVLSNGSTSSSTSVTVQTNASGVAALASWTLGATARSYSISAAFPGATTVFFSATAVAGPAASIALNAGNNQSAPAGTTVPIPPSVVVRDAQGNGVGGVSVQFTVVTSGATVSNGATTTTTVSVTTNPTSGIAQLNAWTLGPVAQTYTMQATLAGVSGSPVTFTANGTASAASSIIVNGGNNQSATVNTAVATPPSVLVRDVNANPVAGTVVTFTVVTAGAQISNGATTGTTLTVTTGANGIAALTQWTLGPLAQQYILTADAPGLVGTPVTFTATAVAGPAAVLVMQAGNNQSAPQGNAVSVPPTVRVMDANSNGVAGVVVTFTPVTAGGQVQNASTTSTGPLTVTTNAQGDAPIIFYVGTTAQQYTLTAAVSGLSGSPVTFIETAVPGPATHLSYLTVPSSSAQSGVALPVQPVIQLRDGPGNAVPQQGVVIVATLTSGTGTLVSATATTDAAGKATFSGLALSGVVGNYTLAFNDQNASLSGLTHNLALTPGSPSRLAVIVNGSTTAVDGIALATQPQIQVRDASNNNVPQSGITILATVAAGNGTLSNASITTNASGTATFSGLTITGIIGTYLLNINSTGLTGTSLSPITVTIGAPSAIVASAGTGQTATAGEAVPIAPAFRVVDVGNNGISGQSVLFNTVPAGSQITNSSTCCNNLTVVTNANGVATLVSWTLSTTAGTNTLTGSVPASPSIGSASMTATGVASNGNSIQFITRPGTPTTSGALLSPQPSFQIMNGQGLPVAVANVPVTAFIVVGTSGSATLTGTTTVLTNASGVATFTNLAVTGPSGSFSLRFRSPGYTGTQQGMSIP